MRLVLASCALGVALLLGSPAQGDPPCAAWAGEFDPLPTVSDPDPLRARWAGLRSAQLVELASRAEPRDREQANRLWERVRCLDPDSAAALAGIERTRADAVSRAPEPQPPERSDGAAPARRERSKPERSKRIAAIVRERPQPVVQARAEPASVAAPLDRTESLIRAARFDDALGEIERLRPEAVRPAERARLEVLAATAQVAFGDERSARASIERALHADPMLALDERSTSPKLLRVLEAARAVGSGPAYTPAAADVKPVAEPGAPQ